MIGGKQHLDLKTVWQIKPFVWGAIITGVVIAVSLLAPLIAPADPLSQNLSASLSAPGEGYIFGADALGRDVFSRVIYGSRITLAVSSSVLLLAVLIGTILGTAAGYFGGVIDTVIMRTADIILALPGLIIAIIVMAFIGAGVTNLILVFTIGYWAVFARLTRGQVISIKDLSFVDAARISGTRPLGIIIKHILPNCFSPIIAYSTIVLGEIIIGETALSFLGLGIQPPAPSWGVMLSDAKNYIFTAPWLVVFPSLAIVMIVLGFNLLGDGLNCFLNPKQQNRRIEVFHGNFKSK
ncbi:MAG: hypothetical protein CVU89_14710 [Firmicutes bacterium HGW-Firmicutes-14]|nr:MAG: hypothetical protein CVU89_14710 [Firmicutes bacterium HGW-Firmicutes-14]